MTRKPKEIPFKKGDQVIIVSSFSYHHLRVEEAVVSQIRRQEGIVHTQHFDKWKHVWKRAFSIHAHMYGQDPYPMWMIQPHPGKDKLRRIQKRFKEASRNFEEYQQAAAQIRRDVDYESRQWANEQETKRIAKLPHNSQYIDRVMRRWGFKKPTNNN